MEYHKIIAVTGLGGLFELVGSKADGAIVRSLEDKSTKFISSRVHNFSHLESIEIFTEKDNVNLVDVLNAMNGSKETLPDEKDAAAVKKYFEKVYPEMDFERVYSSDTKKMVRWFKVLKANNVEFKLREVEPEAEEETVEVEKETKKAKAEEASAEIKAPKKAAAKKEVSPETEEAPKKKAAKKKKED